jgi:YqaJ-like recombinase protein
LNARKVTPTGILVAPSGIPEAEWLALRKTGIGGSDIGALLGMSKYTSPYELYLDKRGELGPGPEFAGVFRAYQRVMSALVHLQDVGPDAIYLTLVPCLPFRWARGGWRARP